MASADGQEITSKPKNKEEEPEERTDGWMATYADMVTLLLTFFVLMFALSNVDQQKFEMFAIAMSTGSMTQEQFEMVLARHMVAGDDGEDGLPTIVGPSELDHLYDRILDYIDSSGIGSYISMEYNGESLLLNLANDIWFAPGSADITAAMATDCAVIARLISETFNPEKPFEVVVVGHTDNIPIGSARFANNWELSVARAVSFIRILITESRLDPGYFSVRGYGEERPIADNSTPEGRQANRRVEVFITSFRQE